MPHRKKGSQQRQWRRMDLHLHTPASVDYKQANVTYLDLLKRAEEKNLDVISFTDHNTVSGYAKYLEEVESLELLERLNRLRDDERSRLAEYRRLREKILILPGFEFTATLGFHILGIFPPDTTIRELEHLLLSLRVPPDKLDQGSGEVGATTDALTAYRMINEAGGLVIAAHANSSHGVAMPGFDFGGQTRIAYTQDPNLHALEVTDLDSKSRRRTAAFFSGTKPEYPRRMHAIQGSDAHKLVFDPHYKNEMGVGDRATEILLDDLEFEAIKEIFLGSDFARTRPYRPPTEEPYDPIRDAREQGDTLVQAFHERLHEKRGIARSILEDVVALANTNGGTVYIGASTNIRTPVAGVERPEQASAELRGAISKEITPPLEVQIDVVKSQSKNILQVIVPRGSDVPYALEGTYIYVRSENETGLAMRDEIVQLVRDALAVEMAGAPLILPGAERRPPEEASISEPVAQASAPNVVLPVEVPRTGVEVVSAEMRKGVMYYSVRDLRNTRVVQNVTRASARRLWQYAIEEREKNPCDESKVNWIGNIGIWKSHKRGGKTRYDLCQRVGQQLFVYYGVTEDGIHGAWRKLVESEAGSEPEEVPEDSATRAVLAPGTPEELEAIAQTETSSALPPSGENGGQLAEMRESVEQEIKSEEAGIEEPLSSSPSPEESLIPSGLAEPVAAPEQSYEMTSSAEAGTHGIEEDLPTSNESLASVEATAEESAAFDSNPIVPPEEQAAPPTTAESSETPSTPEPERLPEAPSPLPPTAPKSRAQEWREILDRAIAEAMATQQSAESRSEGTAQSRQGNGQDVAPEPEHPAETGNAEAAGQAHSPEGAESPDVANGA